MLANSRQAPSLQSNEGRPPILIATDPFGSVIGRGFNAEFSEHQTMSASQLSIFLSQPDQQYAWVLAMGVNPVAIWSKDGSPCELIRRGGRSRLLSHGDKISLVAQPTTGQVDAGTTYTLVLGQPQAADATLGVPPLARVPPPRVFGRRRITSFSPKFVVAASEITGPSEIDPMEMNYAQWCESEGLPPPTDDYLRRYERIFMPRLEEIDVVALRSMCDTDNIHYDATEEEDASALAERIRESGSITIPAARAACRSQGYSSHGTKDELLARLQRLAETRYRGARAEAIRSRVAQLSSSRRFSLHDPKGRLFTFPKDVLVHLIGAHPSLTRDGLSSTLQSRSTILDQMCVALNGETEERVEELLDNFEVSNLSMTGDMSKAWLVYDAIRALIRIGESALEASVRGERLAAIFVGKLGEMLRQFELDPLKMFDPIKTCTVGSLVEQKLEPSRGTQFGQDESERGSWGNMSVMTFEQCTMKGESVAHVRITDGDDRSVLATFGWLWHPNYVEGALAQSTIDRPMALWRDVLAGRPHLPEMSLDLRALRSLLDQSKPKGKPVNSKRDKKAKRNAPR